MPDPYAIATYRFEQIAFLLDEALPKALRAKCWKEATGEGPSAPSGEEKRASRSTRYRWLQAYRKDGLKGLMPKRRSDYGKVRVDRSEWTSYAIALLLERSDRSFAQVLHYVKYQFPGSKMTRSTLRREVKRHPAYGLVLKQRRLGRSLKRRFQASEPHELWQLDAKGPFQVRLKDGRTLRVVILSILDDCTRSILAATFSRSESLVGAVKVFRSAAMRWGLPTRIYCDRHSVYDSDAFRHGLAELGVHRIRTRPRRKEARGKIERYHRVLDQWFIQELRHQEILDDDHLEELLQATLDLLYQQHKHRALGCSPAEALREQRSKRDVSPEDLQRAFWITKALKTHPKTGEVVLAGITFCVPSPYAGQRCRFTYDPVQPENAFLLTENDIRLPLQPTFRKPSPQETPRSARGAGALQQILDQWRGRTLPLAPPGFGLPEIFQAFSQHLGRNVPATEQEAETLQSFYRENGPFDPQAFQNALLHTLQQLGPQRPIGTYIRHLQRLIVPPKPKES